MEISDLSFQSDPITVRIKPPQLDGFLPELSEWQIEGLSIASLVRDFRCDNFLGAMALAEKVSALAEKYNHHPELTITWGNLRVSWWTHTASGITSNDVYMAHQCDLMVQDN